MLFTHAQRKIIDADKELKPIRLLMERAWKIQERNRSSAKKKWAAKLAKLRKLQRRNRRP